MARYTVEVRRGMWGKQSCDVNTQYEFSHDELLRLCQGAEAMWQALHVFCCDPKLLELLELNDPMALRQANEALGEVSIARPWSRQGMYECNFCGKKRFGQPASGKSGNCSKCHKYCWNLVQEE